MIYALLFSCVRLLSTSPTFYFRVGPDVHGCPKVQSFQDGKSYGPCGVNGQAIRNAAPHCGKEIVAEDEESGRKVSLVVMDSCPACETDNHLDMSLEALIQLSGSAKKACAIDCLPPKIKWQFLLEPLHLNVSKTPSLSTKSSTTTVKSIYITPVPSTTNNLFPTSVISIDNDMIISGSIGTFTSESLFWITIYLFLPPN